MKTSHSRRTLFAAALALGVCFLPAVQAQNKIVVRVSTSAVPDDWHGKMWTVMKDELERTAPGQFDVQINLNATLFKQGTEPAAMARGNLELASISAFDIAKLAPEFSIFTAGYIVRDPDHQQKVFNGAIGQELFNFRAGPYDFSCATCHGQDGLRIRTQDLPNLTKPAEAIRAFQGWPGYRMTNGRVLSLQWRMNDCFRQQRFPEPKYLSDAISAIMMYQAVNANGIVYGGPGIKR